MKEVPYPCDHSVLRHGSLILNVDAFLFPSGRVRMLKPTHKKLPDGTYEITLNFEVLVMLPKGVGVAKTTNTFGGTLRDRL